MSSGGSGTWFGTSQGYLNMHYQTIKQQIKQSKLSWIIPYIKGVFALKEKLFDLRNQILAKRWPEKSIVYYAGHTMNEWSPDSLKTGIGGSETALVNLVREWTKLGYTVTVYGNFGKKAGMYDGATYCHYTQFNRFDTFDTLIIWRRIDAINFSYNANRVWFDVHDVQ
jgi:hypothetical protein